MKPAACNPKTTLGRTFPNPAVLLAHYHPSFQSGKFKIYDKQLSIHRRFSTWRTGDDVLRMCVCGNNGCGKSTFIIAPAAIWLAISFDYSLGVITSASQAQLYTQTMPAIRTLAEAMNKVHDGNLWDITESKLKFLPTNSVIIGRVTDQSNKLEGFHPLVPGAPFCKFIDEAKGIEPDLYVGVNRWTGATHIMEVSSAGQPSGDFYEHFTSDSWHRYKLTCEDTPHITKSEIAEINRTYGEQSAYARSILWSEFTLIDGSLVLAIDSVRRCARAAQEGKIPHYREPFNRAGVDFSGGGDEMVVSVWNGNKQLAIEPVPVREPTAAVDYMTQHIFRKWNLVGEYIWCDAGGLGIPYISMLKAAGYKVNPMWNQKAPVSATKHNWANIGTENWHKLARLIEECKIIPLPDRAQSIQFANRYYTRQESSGKIMVEPKGKAKAHGHPSPDRADAAILALCRWKQPDEKVIDTKTSYLAPKDYVDWHNRQVDEGWMHQEDEAESAGAPTLRQAALACYAQRN